MANLWWFIISNYMPIISPLYPSSNFMGKMIIHWVFPFQTHPDSGHRFEKQIPFKTDVPGSWLCAPEPAHELAAGSPRWFHTTGYYWVPPGRWPRVNRRYNHGIITPMIPKTRVKYLLTTGTVPPSIGLYPYSTVFPWVLCVLASTLFRSSWSTLAIC